MPVITKTQLENASLDADSLALFVNGESNQDVTTRLGEVYPTVQNLIADIYNSAEYLAPVTYTSGLLMSTANQTVIYSGTVYAPLVSEIPFTTSGTFETSKFRVIQGITRSELASSIGATLIGANTYQTQDAINNQIKTPYQFGVIGDGVADDTSALNAFLAAVYFGLIPAGTYKITGPLNFRSNQFIEGQGYATHIVYSAVSPATNAPVFSMSTLTGTTVKNLRLSVPAATYPTARTLFMDTCTRCHYQDITLTGGGGNAAYLTGSTGGSVARVNVDDYRSNGFYITAGAGCTIDDCDIPNGVNGLMGIQFVEGEGHTAKNNRIAFTPNDYFGIHVYGGRFHVADKNIIRNTRREALALGGTTSLGCRITNNTFYWDTNLGTGDFGMSVAGNDSSNVCADFLIAGNTIINSALDGIGLAGWCQRGRVTNNIIRDCARASASGHQSGVKMYGWLAGAFVNDCVVEHNTISKISGSSGLTSAVYESPELGTVSGNLVQFNNSTGISGSPYIVTSTSQLALNDDDIALKILSTSLTASTGTVTTSSGTLKYQFIGRFILCRLYITITTNGTGSGTLIFPLPFSVLAGILTGSEAAINGKACKAGASGATLIITNYDNTYPGANGAVLALSGILEI